MTMRLGMVLTLLLGLCPATLPCASAEPAVAAMPCHGSPASPKKAPDCSVMPCCQAASLSSAPALVPALRVVALLNAAPAVVAAVVRPGPDATGAPPGPLALLRAARRLGRSPPAA